MFTDNDTRRAPLRTRWLALALGLAGALTASTASAEGARPRVFFTLQPTAATRSLPAASQNEIEIGSEGDAPVSIELWHAWYAEGELLRFGTLPVTPQARSSGAVTSQSVASLKLASWADWTRGDGYYEEEVTLHATMPDGSRAEWVARRFFERRNGRVNELSHAQFMKQRIQTRWHESLKETVTVGSAMPSPFAGTTPPRGYAERVK